jgi:hypothetical protein
MHKSNCQNTKGTYFSGVRMNGYNGCSKGGTGYWQGFQGNGAMNFMLGLSLALQRFGCNISSPNRVVCKLAIGFWL